MTTVVTVLDRAARQLSIAAPSSWISATDDEYKEIRDDFLRQACDDLLDRVDWPSPLGITYAVTGTGVEEYALPSNFRRLQRHPLSVYDSQLDVAGTPVTTEGEWVEIEDSGTPGAVRYYRVFGYEGAWQIGFLPVPSTNITLSYITTRWMVTSGGSYGNMLTADTDILLLPERIVEAGIVWRWRERKGLPFTDKYMEHETLLARMGNDLKGRRTISFGERRIVRWQDRVPATIPSS